MLEDPSKTDSASPDPQAPATRTLAARAFFRLAVMAVLTAALLLGAAGTAAWPGGLVFLAIFFGASALITADLARRDPALLAERLTPLAQAGQPGWDKLLLRLLVIGFVAWIGGMGLDQRRGEDWPVWLPVLGGGVLSAGMALIAATFRANTFLAPVVRMQAERAQAVVSTGPYAVVRHPMYAGAVLLFIGTPLLLSSILGMAGSLLLIVLLVWRTALEDKTLAAGLNGYPAYADKVRYRLAPGLW